MKIRMKRILIYVGAILVTLYTLIPFYIMWDMSIMHLQELFTTPFHWIPWEPTPTNYGNIFGVILGEGRWYNPTLSVKDLQQGYINSLFIATIVAVFATLAGSLAAYAFARLKFRFKNAALMSLILMRALPPISIIVPYYFIFSRYGLIGTHLGLFIAYSAAAIPILTWVLIGHFSSIPVDLERASRMDGCSRLASFRRVFLPVAFPGIAAALLYVFTLVWNEFLFALIISAGTQAQMLTPAITGLFTHNNEYAMTSAAAMLGIIPPLLVALIFQRYILRLRIVDPIATPEAQ